MKIIKLIIALVIICFADKAAAQDNNLVISNVLQSNMIVQQGKALKVWGNATPDAKVTVIADFAKPVITTTGKDGKWIANVIVPEAKAGDFKQHEIKITSGANIVTLTNILIGDVWIASGQSNMSMYMKKFEPWHHGVIDYENEIAKANYPNIRFLTLEKDTSYAPRQMIQGDWQAVSPATAATLSAVSYYFGRDLYNNLNIPIGLVISAYGGAAAQAFTSREVLANNELLKKTYLDPYDAAPDAKGVTGRPTLIYNAMIAPLAQLSVKGFIWYQGESNAGIKGLYPTLNTEMVKGWCKDFNQGNLPFYFVQMPYYNWKKHDPYEYGYALFREEQEALLTMIPNSGMAVAIELGDTTIVHPSKKKEIGERLSKIALVQTYGKKLPAYEGPVYEGMKVEGDRVVINYKKESLGSGLVTADDNAPVTFFISGSDKKFYPAAAAIQNNAIVLHCAKVKKPVAIRYAFTNYPITNLKNKEGYPARPFRTDDWDKAKMLPLD